MPTFDTQKKKTNTKTVLKEEKQFTSGIKNKRFSGGTEDVLVHEIPTVPVESANSGNAGDPQSALGEATSFQKKAQAGAFGNTLDKKG